MIIAAFVFLSAASAYAQNTTWQIKSAADNYTIEVLNSKKGRIDGKDISLEPMSKYTAVTNRKFVDGCPELPRKAPIEIIQTRNSETKSWKLYTTEGIWSDGSNCLAVAGEGLSEFPIHRLWFTAPNRNAVELGNQFSIVVGGDTVTFANDRGAWNNSDPDFFTNWSLVENLTNTLNGFTIGVRTVKRPGDDAATFTIKTARKSYKFIQVGEDWASEIESTKWLSISPDFRWLREMSLAALRSPQAAELASLKKTDTPEQERLAIMKNLAKTWNADIKHALHDLVSAREEQTEIKRQAALYLKYHPTDENILVLARALLKTDDSELQNVISDALRVRDPKGPRIHTTDKPHEIEKKIQQWQKWANDLQATPKK